MEPQRDQRELLPPPVEDWKDPVIEAYKRDVDRTLIAALADLTPDQRMRGLQKAVRDLVELRRAGRRAFGR
jgi:hypothetical protein